MRNIDGEKNIMKHIVYEKNDVHNINKAELKRRNVFTPETQLRLANQFALMFHQHRDEDRTAEELGAGMRQVLEHAFNHLAVHSTRHEGVMPKQHVSCHISQLSAKPRVERHSAADFAPINDARGEVPPRDLLYDPFGRAAPQLHI